MLRDRRYVEHDALIRSIYGDEHVYSPGQGGYVRRAGIAANPQAKDPKIKRKHADYDDETAVVVRDPSAQHQLSGSTALDDKSRLRALLLAQKHLSA